jgi:hypothetical protein
VLQIVDFVFGSLQRPIKVIFENQKGNFVWHDNHVTCGVPYRKNRLKLKNRYLEIYKVAFFLIQPTLLSHYSRRPY